MTDNQSNGDNPAALAEARQRAADAQAQAMIVPAYVVAMNGVLRTLQMYPLDRLVVTVAGIMGKTVGETLSICAPGDLSALMKLRKMCVDEFEREMRKVPIQTQALNAAPNAPVLQMTRELMRKLNG